MVTVSSLVPSGSTCRFTVLEDVDAMTCAVVIQTYVLLCKAL